MSEQNYFVARDGQEIGPFTRDELLRAIAQARFGKGDLLWQDSVGEWLPLEKVEPFSRQIGVSEVIDADAAPATLGESMRQREPRKGSRRSSSRKADRGSAAPPAQPTADALPLPAAPPAAPAREGELLRPGDRRDLSQRRPFVRYAARLLDMALFTFIVVGSLSLLGLRLGPQQALLLEIFVLALYVPVEALLLGRFGNTPGKALLRVRVVREDGRPLDQATAMNRAVMVWWRGWGIGVPLVSFVALIVAFVKLMSEGQSSWDRDLRTRVLHGTVGFGRGLLVLILILFLFGSSMGSITQRALELG